MTIRQLTDKCSTAKCQKENEEAAKLFFDYTGISAVLIGE